jgi:hypothetical protein
MHAVVDFAGVPARVSEDAIRQQLLDSLQLRVEAEMTRYIQRRLTAAPADRLPVIGSDARTGAALRKFIATGDFMMPTAPPPQ